MISLPEERALLGQGPQLGDSPVKLDPNDLELSRYRDKAQRIFDQGGYFTNEDLHAIVAQFVLGL